MEKEIELIDIHKKKVTRKDSQGIVHVIFFPLMIVYCEVMLRLFTKTDLLTNILYPVLFGLSAGMLISIITMLFSGRVNHIISKVFVLIIAFFYALECVVKNSFRVYMDVPAMANGTKGVVTTYFSDMLKAVLGNIWFLVVLLVPVLFYFILGKKLIYPARGKLGAVIVSAALCAAFFVSGHLLALNGSVSHLYTDQFNFSSSVDAFGLITGFRLDITNQGSTGFVTEEIASAPEDEEETGAEEEKPVEYNVLDIDFAALSEKDDGKYADIDSYVSSLSPSVKNDYTGLFEGKNLILICAESFSDCVINEELTPTLYRLMHNGFYFSDYYQPTWGGSTITGEFSFLTGLVQTGHDDTNVVTKGVNLSPTMGNQLKGLGYFSLCFHDGSYDFYQRNETQTNFGYDEFIAFGSGLENYALDMTDTEMFRTTVDMFVEHQPFSVYYLTVSGHCTYEETSDFVYKYYEQVNSVVGDKYSEKVKYYLCYQMDFEAGLTDLINQLDEAGVLDDTVICITGDHYPYGLAVDAFGNTEDYVADLYGYSYEYQWEQDHNALLIWSGCLENDEKDMACEIDTPVYSIDILPTLSNLFGLEYDSRLLPGRDVFSDTAALVVWNTYSWMTEYATYDAATGMYELKDGMTEEEFKTLMGVDFESYCKGISAQVSNKITYSNSALFDNYFEHVFGSDERD